MLRCDKNTKTKIVYLMKFSVQSWKLDSEDIVSLRNFCAVSKAWRGYLLLIKLTVQRPSSAGNMFHQAWSEINV